MQALRFSLLFLAFWSRSRFLPLAALIVLPTLATSAAAQGNGKMTPYVITLLKLEDKGSSGTATINLKGRVWVSTLVGEPVVACNTEWSFWNGVGGGPVIRIDNKQISGIPRKVLDRITLYGVKLGFATKPFDTRMFASNTSYELACDPGALEKPDSGKASFTVPGSPSWDETFYARGSYDGENKTSAKYLDVPTAKRIMIHLLKNGFATDSSSARVLTATINLGAVVDWLDAKEKLAEEKLKDEQKKAAELKAAAEKAAAEKAAAEKKAPKEKVAATEKESFWSRLWSGKKDKAAETKKKSGDDDFWSGKGRPGKQASNQQTAKVGTDKFWRGSTSIFDEAPVQPEKSVSGSHLSTRVSLFDDKPAVTQKKSPLDDVVQGWLEQDKEKLVKGQEEKQKKLSAYCGVGVPVTGGFKLTARPPICDRNKHFRGFTCDQQKAAWRIKWYGTPEEQRRRKNKKKLEREKRRLACSDFNKNGGKPGPEFQAKLRALDAEIEAERRAGVRAAAAGADQATREENAAFARHRDKVQRAKDKVRAQYEAAKKLSGEKTKQANAKHRQFCRTAYFERGQYLCGCGPELPEVSATSCMK